MSRRHNTPKPIVFRVSNQMLQRLFRLPLHTRVIGARYDASCDQMVFHLDAQTAPDNATELKLTYHHNGQPDPISVREVRWEVDDSTAGRESDQAS